MQPRLELGSRHRALGERVCCFLRPEPGAEVPTLDAVRAGMAEAGLGRQKWPEEVHPGDDLPRTPSGKVQKAILRQRLRTPAAHPTGPRGRRRDAGSATVEPVPSARS